MKRPISFRRFFILLFWLAAWQLASISIKNVILMVGPVDVVFALARMIVSGEFWLSIAHSFARITLGFFAAFFCGALLGSLAYRFPLLCDILEPVVHIMKAIPVASFVILALIWTGSKNLSVLISFLVVFPVIYVNTLAGLASTDQKLLEMAQVFRVPLFGRIRCIYLPALLPYLISGCGIALGMSWKSGVAAEVIGIPAHSIGERLYMAKIYLETADVFAWTIVIILVSALFEKLVLALIRSIPLRSRSYIPTQSDSRPAPVPAMHPAGIHLTRVCKSFGELKIFENLSLQLDSEKVYCLTGSSGRGKTTLLRMILGLENADGGEICFPGQSKSPAICAVFQEDRLCERFSPLDNVLLTADRRYTRRQIYEELCLLLPEESVSRPVSTLSGGMKRRVAIVRAMLTSADIILMDEPFTGLDETTRHHVIRYILEKQAGRLLLISTHQDEDILLLGAEVIRL